MWYLFSAAAVCADRLTKYKARQDTKSREFLRGHLRWHPMENAGLAGSRGKNHPKLVKLLPTAAFALSAPVFLLSLRQTDALGRCGISLMLCGGGSNVYDRLRRGTVTDMLQFPKAPGRVKKLIFNAADLMLFLGAVFTGIALGREK